MHMYRIQSHIMHFISVRTCSLSQECSLRTADILAEFSYCAEFLFQYKISSMGLCVWMFSSQIVCSFGSIKGVDLTVGVDQWVLVWRSYSQIPRLARSLTPDCRWSVTSYLAPNSILSSTKKEWALSDTHNNKSVLSYVVSCQAFGHSNSKGTDTPGLHEKCEFFMSEGNGTRSSQYVSPAAVGLGGNFLHPFSSQEWHALWGQVPTETVWKSNSTQVLLSCAVFCLWFPIRPQACLCFWNLLGLLLLPSLHLGNVDSICDFW